jgi:hypothetical protein
MKLFRYKRRRTTNIRRLCAFGSFLGTPSTIPAAPSVLFPSSQIALRLYQQVAFKQTKKKPMIKTIHLKMSKMDPPIARVLLLAKMPLYWQDAGYAWLWKWKLLVQFLYNQFVNRSINSTQSACSKQSSSYAQSVLFAGEVLTLYPRFALRWLMSSSCFVVRFTEASWRPLAILRYDLGWIRALGDQAAPRATRRRGRPSWLRPAGVAMPWGMNIMHECMHIVDATFLNITQFYSCH